MATGDISSNQHQNADTVIEVQVRRPRVVEIHEQAAFTELSETGHLADLDARCVPLPENFAYRLAERSVALLSLIALAPLLLAIACALRAQGLGTVFYTQTRVGRGERLFTIYKFRTMRPDAEREGPFICTNYKDERITRLGKMLRKSKLDELPQLWNIVLGQMAFVGPRPERPHFHAQFCSIPHWRERTTVYPGLTGLAQASKWISHDPEQKLEADRVYIDNRNMLLDLSLIFFTLFPKLRPSRLFGIHFG